MSIIKVRETGNKVIACMGGMIVALVLLELGLRIFGSLQEDRAQSFSRQSGSVNTVMCVGDSFTYGIGAPADKSYPQQLEALLNARVGTKWVVVNRGRPATNSSQIYESLEKNIDIVNPRVVVVLAGGANTWNYKGYAEFRRANIFAAKLLDLLYDLRTFKLLKLFMRGDLQKKSAADEEKYGKNTESDEFSRRGWEYVNHKQYEKAVASFKEGVKRYPLSDVNYWNLVHAYDEWGKRDEAEEYFRKAIKLKRLTKGGYAWLGDYCQKNGRMVEAFDLYKKGMLADLHEENFMINGGLEHLYALHDIDLEGEMVAFARLLHDKYHVRNPFVDMVLKGSQKVTDVHDTWLAYDMGRIIELCRRKKIFVIVQNYPAEANDLYRKIGSQYGVPLVDNTKLFYALLQKETSEKYFVPDGHCSALGYGIMAQNVYNAMAAAGIIKEPEAYGVFQSTGSGK